MFSQSKDHAATKISEDWGNPNCSHCIFSGRLYTKLQRMHKLHHLDLKGLLVQMKGYYEI